MAPGQDSWSARCSSAAQHSSVASRATWCGLLLFATWLADRGRQDSVPVFCAWLRIDGSGTPDSRRAARRHGRAVKSWRSRCAAAREDASVAAAAAAATGAAVIVWFRKDLRLRDNQALRKAMALRKPIVPVYLWQWESAETGGLAEHVFLAGALTSLAHSLKASLGLPLVVATLPSAGSTDEAAASVECIKRLAEAGKADAVLYHSAYNPRFEDALASGFVSAGLQAEALPGHLMREPAEDYPWREVIESHRERSPLIPFVARHLKNADIPRPAALPERVALGLQEASERAAAAMKLDMAVVDPAELCARAGRLLGNDGEPPVDWAKGIRRAWPSSEDDAHAVLHAFLEERSRADGQALRTHLSSRVSTYLAHGLLSPREAYWAAQETTTSSSSTCDAFYRRLAWRDYSYYVWRLFPDMWTQAKQPQPIRCGYRMPPDELQTDRDAASLLQLWKRGRTGYPLVDAGMRQLWAEGFMPQVVRIACASFLIEVLWCDWRDGLQHFRECLVDHDPAINVNMWMNAALVGFDPYYVGPSYTTRAYWDTDGSYVASWCPELSGLSTEKRVSTGQLDALYEPWKSPAADLEAAHVQLGATYPQRCVDARERRRRFWSLVREQRARWPSAWKDEQGRDLVRLGDHPADCDAVLAS
eukprot:TRINITY_DN32847_c0_g1_i6.p1 TRINITY_DN32847_c0_g1~~TRINITY_DN32847_c0_g1_i6.p1  ORF type:complete len:649 (-),score=84.80 TRINITY_DN32847_c0_g1_i6:243-2189(-)